MCDTQSVADKIQELTPEIRRRHASDLARISRRFDVDDLVQTVAIKAHNSAACCQAETAAQLRNWVLTIAQRAVQTAVTREVNTHKRSLKLETDKQSWLTAAKDTDIFEVVSQSEQRTIELARVNQQLAALPPRQAQAIRLRYLEELEYSEIAAQLNITLQAVRSLVSKGLAAVRSASR